MLIIMPQRASNILSVTQQNMYKLAHIIKHHTIYLAYPIVRPLTWLALAEVLPK